MGLQICQLYVQYVSFVGQVVLDLFVIGFNILFPEIVEEVSKTCKEVSV